MTHKNHESRLINFIVKRTGNSRAAPQFSEIYMKNETPFFLQATFIIVIAHALENVLVNLSCCLRCCRQKSWLQNYLWWSPKTHSHFQVKSLEKQSAAHSIFCQVSDSRLIKLSRFLLFRLTFLSIMYQFTALHWLKAPNIKCLSVIWWISTKLNSALDAAQFELC